MGDRMIGGRYIMFLTQLVMRSSLDEDEQGRLLDRVPNMYQGEAEELQLYLEAHQLDLTQLGSYTTSDINKRLDYIDIEED